MAKETSTVHTGKNGGPSAPPVSISTPVAEVAAPKKRGRKPRDPNAPPPAPNPYKDAANMLAKYHTKRAALVAEIAALDEGAKAATKLLIPDTK